jgi:hypothetical protein
MGPGLPLGMPEGRFLGRRRLHGSRAYQGP